jgi:hypothetical protein
MNADKAKAKSDGEALFVMCASDSPSAERNQSFLSSSQRGNSAVCHCSSAMTALRESNDEA